VQDADVYVFCGPGLLSRRCDRGADRAPAALFFTHYALRTTLPFVSKKSPKIAALIERYRDQPYPAHYLGYFDCFNRELFYESHDVLEELWLTQRQGPNDGFYKALIQLAGAFVHLQKDRLRPAAALFKLARSYLRNYPPQHEGLDVTGLCTLIEAWLAKLERGEFQDNPLQPGTAPKLVLLDREFL
jgi:predicted metal-dependent hydrolase